jgi:hypothetical protein
MAIDVNGITLSSSGGTTLAMANGATNWMNVNANGIVNRTQTPYMQAILSGQATFYNASPMVFGSVQANQGSCWNNSTGLWTCPVAGYYLVFMSGIASGSANGTASYGYPYINKNGATYTFSHWNHASYWEYANLTAIVSCAANDTISFSLTTGATGGFYGAGDHCSFGIALVI